MCSVEAIKRRACQAAFGKPLVTNVLRGLVAEAIVEAALCPDWHWCSEDYSPWDFQHRGGLRLEVRNSAARQSWAKDGSKPSVINFDIAARKGRYEDGVTWIGEAGRNAQIYVLCHHPICDRSADHRDPFQWEFFVIPTARLPTLKTIGVRRVRSLSEAYCFRELRAAVERVRESIGHADLESR